MSKQYTILTIEDETAVRESIKAHLEDCNYIVLEADSGEKGIDIFRNAEPDAVLVDLKMPGIHGLEVIEVLYQISSTTPIIVVSGTGDVQSAVTAIHNGACDYILKPIMDLKVLNHTIDKCLNRNRARKEEELYRQHLERELKRKSEEIENRENLFSDFNKALNKIINSAFSIDTLRRLKDIGSHLLDNFGSHLLASGGSVYIREDGGLRLIHSLEPTHSPEFLSFPLRKDSPFRRVLETGKPILINNIESEAGMASSGWDGYDDSSFMIFPLPDHEGNVTGLLSLHNKIKPPFISEDKEMGMLMTAFYREATRAMHSIESLQLSEARYNTLTENSSAVIFSFSVEKGSFDFINNAFESITGYSQSDIINKDLNTFVECLRIKQSEDFISHFENLISGQSSGSGMKYQIYTSENEIKWVFQKTVAILNAGGVPVTIDGIITEYSQQKEVEKELKQLVEQKDLLLNEINHRVKNNMQIISSFINLQVDLHRDDEITKPLLATEERITTMALVHDNIYDTELMPTIDIKNYTEKLVRNIFESKSRLPNINIEIDVDDIYIDLDRSILCGLIINEAVSNAFMHAFPDNRGGTIKLIFQKVDDNYQINILDNGVGISESFDESRQRGLGIDIMNSLIIQLNGRLEFTDDKGTLVLVEFPIINPAIKKEIL